LMGVDKTIHKYGKKSNESQKAIKKVDGIVKRYVNDFLNKNQKGEIFLWSDHGFSDIEEYINLESILPLKKEDGIYFIAGTTTHFWFKNEDSKKKFLEKIHKIKKIYILNKKTADNFGIPFDRKYGDLIIYTKKKNFFFPNFYEKYEGEKFLSMHGYPNDKELNGFLLSNKKIPKKLKIHEVMNYIK